jgi:hypothetical protein
MKKLSMILAGAALLFGAVQAQAQTYDFVADYSIASNPNGTWSYGWEPYRGGPFTLMNSGWTDYSWGTQDVWSSTTAPSSPSIALAVTDINHPTIFVPAGTVNTHPGYYGENAVVRWTAPASGTYQLEGWFTGNDHGWDWQTGVTTTTDVAILRGPFEVFSGFVESYNVPLPFLVTMPLLAGETVDLTVGFGRNGSYWHDSTGVTATFTKVSDEACGQPPAGMISWWTGDLTANDSVGGHNGTLVNGAAFAQGTVGPAFAFDGIDDYMDVPDSESLDITSELTIDAWMMPLESKVHRVITKWGMAGFRSYNLDITDDGRVAFYTSSDGANFFFRYTAAGEVPVGQWTHVAAVYKAGAHQTIYVNGVPKDIATGGTEGPPSSLYNSTSPFRLARNFNDDPTPFFYHGALDEVEIFNRALTAEEIQSIYFAGSAGKCKELVVTIDITPGGFPNSINPAGRGVIPVAILTTGTFNAAIVDAATVRFGPNSAPPSSFLLQDVDLDGDLDLILQFRTQQTGIVCGMTSATLTGKTIDGMAITGTDSVNTVGCR